MNEVLKWAGLIGAGWVLVSIPVALVLGQVLKRRNRQLSQQGLRLVSDERYAQQAGEQR